MFPFDDVMEVFLFVPIYFAALGSGILLTRNGSVDGLCIALGKGTGDLVHIFLVQLVGVEKCLLEIMKRDVLINLQ